MSREIKFRAWDKDQGQMVYIDLLRLNYWDGQVDSGWYEDDDGNPHDLWSEIKEGRLMRYTGLKDKNGVEIYEGDVLKVVYPQNSKYDHQGVVRWGEYNDSEYVDSVQCWIIDDDVPLEAPSRYRELLVIGNTYENPELLGGGGE